MLNERKVRLMTRAGMYEKKVGKEDLKINSYHKKDYISYQTLITIVWATIGYVSVVGIAAFAFLDELMSLLSLSVLIVLAVCVLGGYLAVVITYGIAASRFHRRRYEEARKRVKIYNHDLVRLGRMYEREEE